MWLHAIALSTLNLICRDLRNFHFFLKIFKKTGQLKKKSEKHLKRAFVCLQI